MVTKRRLSDGERAMELSSEEFVPSDSDLRGLEALRDDLHTGIVALQSLDDLGSEEANQAAWNDMLELQRRHKLVTDKIDALKGKSP